MQHFRRPKGLSPTAHVVTVDYQCDCGASWQNDWDSACDDECPACGATVGAADWIDGPACDCAACVTQRKEDEKMRPEDVDLSRGDLVAFASSEDNGRDRWTECAIYHFADSAYVGRRHWLSVLRGCSRLPGETTRERRLWVGSLERAAKLFDPVSTMAISVIEQARDWEESGASVAAVAPEPDTAPAVPDAMPAFASDWAALAHLYDTVPADLPPWTEMADDLGVGASSIRMAIKRGTGVKVALRSVAPLISRGALAKGKRS